MGFMRKAGEVKKYRDNENILVFVFLHDLTLRKWYYQKPYLFYLLCREIKFQLSDLSHRAICVAASVKI